MSPQTEESIKLVIIGLLAIALVCWFASTMPVPHVDGPHYEHIWVE